YADKGHSTATAPRTPAPSSCPVTLTARLAPLDSRTPFPPRFRRAGLQSCAANALLGSWVRAVPPGSTAPGMALAGDRFGSRESFGRDPAADHVRHRGTANEGARQ